MLVICVCMGDYKHWTCMGPEDWEPKDQGPEDLAVLIIALSQKYNYKQLVPGYQRHKLKCTAVLGGVSKLFFPK